MLCIRRAISFLLVIFFSACQTRQPEARDDLVSDSLMAEVIKDIMLIDASRYVHSANVSKEPLPIAEYYASVFAHHGIQRDTFQRQLELLATQSKRFQKVLNRSLEMLADDKNNHLPSNP